MSRLSSGHQESRLRHLQDWPILGEHHWPLIGRTLTVTRLHLRQEADKPLQDTQHNQVVAHRYQSLRCGHTFRVYPQRVRAAQTADRLKCLAVLPYLLGLGYGAVSLTPEALGAYLSKTTVYEAVQEAAKRVRGMKRE